MKPTEIQVGKTYRNRGKGNTHRTVLEIAKGIQVTWFGAGDPPDEPVVRYRYPDGQEGVLYLRSFAVWAGSEVSE